MGIPASAVWMDNIIVEHEFKGLNGALAVQQNARQWRPCLPYDPQVPIDDSRRAAGPKSRA